MATSSLIKERSAPGASRSFNLVYAMIALVSAVIVLPRIGKSIWTDEAVSMYSAHLSWSALWRQSQVVDRVFLPYYTVLHLWSLINGSLEWARVLSLIAYALTIFVVARLASRLIGFAGGVVAAVLCATNSLMVQGALDVRPYALTALAAALSVSFLIRWFDDEGDKWFWWFALAALAALAFQQFAVLAPLAALVGVAVLRPQMLAKRWRQVVAPLSLVLVVSLIFLLLTFNQRRQVGWIPPLKGAYLLNALNGPAAGSSFGGRVIYTLVAIVIVIVSALIFLRARKSLRSQVSRSEFEHLVIFVAWAALPTFALMAVSIVKSVYVSRYVTSSAPGIALALTALIVQAYNLRPRLARAAAIAAGTLASAVLIVGLVISSSYIAENVKGASAFLATQTRAVGAIAYPNPLTASEFERYDIARHWPTVSTRNRMFWMKDLVETQSAFAQAPENVWVVVAVNSRGFIKELTSHGYRKVGQTIFTGNIAIFLEHFRR